jgi:hypothetical protein
MQPASYAAAALLALGLSGCAAGTAEAPAAAPDPTPVPSPAAGAQTAAPGAPSVGDRLDKYTTVRLTADLSTLSAKERQMIPLLIDAAREQDGVYWHQAYGSRDSLLARVTDPEMRRFVEINYGPWDRLAGDEPFVPGVGAKPEGANYYPTDMTKEQYAEAHRRTAEKLRAAAALAEDAGLRRYLETRAAALMNDQYQASDLAWMDMKDNTIDVIVGPIETYEDQLFGYKTAHEAYVLVKDQAWSQRLSRLAQFLPALQRGLPVDARYKQETPGSDSDLNAYDVIFYAGQANAGSKTIAINLPNDEEVQLQKGTRRLQLKNAMRAKFDQILIPIARELVVADQQPNITFDAFFGNVMFHEVAHGLGVKNTVNGGGTVREALKERASALEEGKADILGLYMVQQLNRQGELPGEDIRNNYVTFLASLFRSIRFGASSAHGRANVATFNYLAEQGAFARGADGKYRVDFPRMEAAMNSLAGDILVMQGNGDYAGVGEFQEKYGSIGAQLQADLDRLATRGIPVDIVFEQGTSVLGL